MTEDEPSSPLRSILPRLPVWVRMLNACGTQLQRSAWFRRRFTVESILEEARRRAGCADGDHDLNLTPLQLLLDATSNDPAMTLFGRMTVQRTLVNVLVNRRLIAQEIAAYPETQQVAIGRPLFIAGMPRTGTTLLQRLLAQDPQFRPLRCWEAMYPAPAPHPATHDTDPRIRRVTRELLLLHSIFPALPKMHPMTATAPEECEWLLQNSLTIPGFVFEYPEFPQFNAWCRQQDQIPAYRYYKLQLQILQRNFPATRWVLKGNEHLQSLDALLHVFPDAGVIQTHRDPAESVPSLLSFYLQLLGLKSTPTEAALVQMVPAMVDEYARTLERAHEIRSREDPNRFFDVSYSQLVAEPLAVVRRIYSKFALELTDSAERRMHQWLAANPQGRHGAHRYSLRQFGLDRTAIQETFSTYYSYAELSRTATPPTSSPLDEPRVTDQDEPSAKPVELMTFEQAMSASDDTLFQLFARHVNPKEAGLLRLGNLDRRYVRAAGLYLYDRDGREYLDLTSGCGSLPLGHNPPEVIEAVQASRNLPSVLLMGYHQLAGVVGRNLAALLPGELSVVTLGSGGAEAVEMALITAVMATGRSRIVACRQSYHGHTLATLALSRQGHERLLAASGPWELRSLELGDLDALEGELRGGQTAAFLIEPILGEGGVIAPPPGYLKAAEELCRRYGTLLIFDEIQTGFGRTGKMFAMEHEGLQPDIVTVGKAFGAGVVPVSAAVTTPAIWKRAYGSEHNFHLAINTFGGNPAACAAALKTMEILVRDQLSERAAKLGAYAKSRLEELQRAHSVVKAIRGCGLFLGVELNPPAAAQRYSGMVISRLLESHGVLTSYYERDRRILRFEPPLTITKAEIDRAVAAFDETLQHGLPSLSLGHATALVRRSFRHGAR